MTSRREDERLPTDPTTDPTKDWLSAPGMKSDTVLCAAARPTKAKVAVTNAIVVIIAKERESDGRSKNGQSSQRVKAGMNE